MSKQSFYYSPLRHPSNHSQFLSSIALNHLKTKGHHSVTSYLHSQLKSCTNHKKRRALYFFELNEGQVLNFCDKCKDLAENQGFSCKNTEEFRRIAYNKQNRETEFEIQKQLRKNDLNGFLEDIKQLYEQINGFKEGLDQVSVDEIENANQIHSLFQQMENEIKRLRRSFDEQLAENRERFAKINEHFRCSISWNQQQLQYLINKVTKNYDQMINSERSYSLNVIVLKQALEQKRNLFEQVETAYKQEWNNYEKTIKFIGQSQLQSMQSIVAPLDPGISGIESLPSAGQKDNSFEQIIKQMSTRSILV